MERKLRGIAAALALVALAVTTQAETLQPLVVGWERFFKLDWQADTRRGKPVVSGHILNDWGMPAARIQLLVEGLGPNGEIVGQRVAWLGGGILTPGSRAYFEIPPAQPAPAYRVSVFAFDWVQTDGGRIFHRF
jgi:hypothetical protein